MLHKVMVLTLAQVKERRRKAVSDEVWWKDFYRWCWDMADRGQTYQQARASELMMEKVWNEGRSEAA